MQKSAMCECRPYAVANGTAAKAFTVNVISIEGSTMLISFCGFLLKGDTREFIKTFMPTDLSDDFN